MTVTIETLEKLERKVTLIVPTDTLKAEVDARLRKIARSTKIDGFRPGKVPLTVVNKRYGGAIEYEVLNDKVQEAFNKIATEANLRIAGTPKISEQKSDEQNAQLIFDAVFEVFPEVQIGDLSSLNLEKVHCEANDAAIQKTIEILQKQHQTFSQRSLESACVDGDRVTVDFEGKVDGEPFEGGRADGFKFMVGEGQMLKEFENAVRGMKSGESKTFPLPFPENYHGKEVAGKTADFLVTVTNIEEAHLPELTDAFAKSLGVEAGTVQGLREDISKNLDREIKQRLIERNKANAFEGLLSISTLDLPKAIVENEMTRLGEEMRTNLKSRGIKDMQENNIPIELFREQAERRVRLGLVVSNLIESNKLTVTPDQIDARLTEISASYENPSEIINWYKSDAARMANVRDFVLENNVVDCIFSKANLTEKAIAFDELMGQGQAA